MSDHVRCDVCGALGNRRMLRVAPNGWAYGVSKLEDQNDELIVYACSPKCQAAFWKRGPGKMDLVTGELTESTLCSVCDAPQFNSPGGVTCPNGHGGAPARLV